MSSRRSCGGLAFGGDGELEADGRISARISVNTHLNMRLGC